jgi:hypothetical protein
MDRVRVPSCRILEFWDIGQIEEWATGTDDYESSIENDPYAETFRTSPHMSNSVSRNPSYACKSVFFLVKVLVKARFPDYMATFSKSLTVLFTTRYQRNFFENFRSLGAIAAEK